MDKPTDRDSGGQGTSVDSGAGEGAGDGGGGGSGDEAGEASGAGGSGVDGGYGSGDGDEGGSGAGDDDGGEGDDGDGGDDGATTTAPHGGTMVRVSANSFDMGCTPGQSDCGADESPVMPVKLSHDYFMGATEVTQGEYQSITGTTPSEVRDCGSDCPVEAVSWIDAAQFANTLSRMEGLTPCYSCVTFGGRTDCEPAVSPYKCDGYRLPTEAEWEAAARCGEDYLYAGSETVDDVAWTRDNIGTAGPTQPVGSKMANACGLYDMSGNVWELVHDWYDAGYYDSAGRTDPEGPATGEWRVCRGGSWRDGSARVRVAARSFTESGSYGDYLGFRIARTVP